MLMCNVFMVEETLTAHLSGAVQCPRYAGAWAACAFICLSEVLLACWRRCPQYFPGTSLHACSHIIHIKTRDERLRIRMDFSLAHTWHTNTHDKRVRCGRPLRGRASCEETLIQWSKDIWAIQKTTDLRQCFMSNLLMLCYLITKALFALFSSLSVSPAWSSPVREPWWQILPGSAEDTCAWKERQKHTDRWVGDEIDGVWWKLNLRPPCSSSSTPMVL